MKTSEVISHYGSQRAAAEALHECTQAAVAQWKDEPPPLRQLEIENRTGGKLVASEHCDRYRVKRIRRCIPAFNPTQAEGA
jgi:hypothetical protein